MTAKQRRKQHARLLHQQRVLFRRLKRQHFNRMREAARRNTLKREVAEMDRHLDAIQREQ